ncbi:NAD(P)H-dependent flavin oxidoreductase, partial [Pseudoalteromonas sp. SIMBA_162]|uniref:NAD(P)H-dependent flavin oxidoreductase n=1 Tax=Pseudoalteromonas sp. SIMBA_162 TaxID=3080867 RepID=UPI00397A7643
TLKHAKKAAEANVDGLILVCAGAGGHGGTLNPFAFLDAVREFWKGYTILAGGISDGRDILAARIMGADFAYMGTKFI